MKDEKNNPVTAVNCYEIIAKQINHLEETNQILRDELNKKPLSLAVNDALRDNARVIRELVEVIRYLSA